MSKPFPKGPWTAEDQGLKGVEISAVVEGWSMRPVAIARIMPFDSRVSTGNLIAAAPELLEGLHWLVFNQSVEGVALDFVNKLIAKAEGK